MLASAKYDDTKNGRKKVRVFHEKQQFEKAIKEID